jgi:hypothetical protein
MTSSGGEHDSNICRFLCNNTSLGSLVINLKSVDLVCRNSIAEAKISSANNQTCAEEACYILEKKEWTGIVEVGHPLVCGWLGLV